MNIREEISNIMSKDPAARSELEVLLCYPGLHAVILHQVAHRLWQARLWLPARFISQFNRALTGIEIHPGATLGRRVFIDHGMGVVIGETTVVGDDVVIYQAVTLGAGAAARQGAQTRGTKRHPTLGRGVVVGSGAEIQGDIYVGDNVQVASGSIVLKDVPPNSIVVGVPARVIYQDGKKITGESPDNESISVKDLSRRITELEAQVDDLKRALEQVDSDKPSKSDEKASPAAEALSIKKTLSDQVDVFTPGSGL